jgi:hypothetical protein
MAHGDQFEHNLDYFEGDERAYRNQPAFWQNIFNEQYGIPTAGRSPYQRWLSNQYQVPATEYALRQAGGFAANPVSGPRTFQEYLQGRQSGVFGGIRGDGDAVTPRPISQFAPTGILNYTTGEGIPSVPSGPASYLDLLTRKSPEAQRGMLEGLPSYVGPTAFYGGLRSQVPGFIAQSRARQAFSPEQRGAFDISREAIGGGSFLNFLATKYGL